MIPCRGYDPDKVALDDIRLSAAPADDATMEVITLDSEEVAYHIIVADGPRHWSSCLDELTGEARLSFRRHLWGRQLRFAKVTRPATWHDHLRQRVYASRRLGRWLPDAVDWAKRRWPVTVETLQVEGLQIAAEANLDPRDVGPTLRILKHEPHWSRMR